MPDILALARAGKAAFGKMDHDQFADALLQQRAGRMAQGDSVELSIGLADFKAGGFAGLDFVQDAVIDVT